LILVDGVSSGVRTDGNGHYILTRRLAGASGTTYSIGAEYGAYDNVARPAVLVERAGFTEANLAFGAWQPGDYDADGDVDLDDFARFAPCLTGPGQGPPAAGCDLFDFDLDGDVDMGDVRLFQASFAP